MKVTLKRGARVSYEWTVDQGHLNSDLHGNGLAGEARSYRKGRAESSDQGDLIAEFEGDHGWFWRNRSNVPATITLRLRGQYSGLKRVSYPRMRLISGNRICLRGLLQLEMRT